MIVVDASAVVEVIVQGPRAAAVGAVLADDGEWWAPEHFTIEVLSALRGLWLGRHLSDQGFAVTTEQASRVAIATYRTSALQSRIVELAPRLTAYDAAYVALAETLHCPLVSLDRRLRSTTGLGCRFLPEQGLLD